MLYIYTDGSCKNNPGAGAFGVIIMDETKSIVIHAYRKENSNTTNNREELKALLYALKYSVDNSNNDFIIYTDSSYSEKIINEWISKWASNNWKNSKNETVENLDLIKSLYYYYNIEFPNFQVKKIKGHCGEVGNELADAAATGDASKIIKIFKKNNIIYMDDNKIDNF